MAVTEANFKLYRCATWEEGATHGGAISATEILSGVDQGIFDDVTNDQRVSGVVEYRKVFFKNCSPNDSVNIKCYISTPYTLTTQHIAIALASGSDQQSAASTYSYTEPAALADGIDLGTLAADASKGVWIRRTVDSGGNGITGDQFALTFGMY